MRRSHARANAHAYAYAHAHAHAQAGRACSFTYTAFATAVGYWSELIANELDAAQPKVSSGGGDGGSS